MLLEMFTIKNEFGDWRWRNKKMDFSWAGLWGSYVFPTKRRIAFTIYNEMKGAS